jgi:sulfate/thiosulfate transport system ATP-binding protein
MRIDIEAVSRRFGSFLALDDVSLAIQPGEFLALLGPSGSGKTTLLRILAGLERVDEGVIRFDGENITGSSAKERNIGLVFQHYALFRHMTVFENVAFGLRVRPRSRRPSRSDIEARVRSLLELVQIGWLADRYPGQLSGGQRQRVALARALAVEPSTLLLDEPFGALDAKVRKELRLWLRKLHDDMGLTSVFVTHDQDEAMELADRIAVMNHGQIQQVGSPREIYDDPISPFVFEFVGNANRFEAVIANGLVTAAGSAVAEARIDAPDGPAILYSRPHQIAIARASEPGLPAIVQASAFIGPTLSVKVTTPASRDVVELQLRRGDSHGALRAGTELRIRVQGFTLFAAWNSRPLLHEYGLTWEAEAARVLIQRDSFSP